MCCRPSPLRCSQPARSCWARSATARIRTSHRQLWRDTGRSTTASLGVVGILLSFGLSPVGCVPLAWAGARWADDHRSRLPTSHRPVRSRVWTGIAAAAAATTVASELLLPVAVGIGSAPLVAAVITGRITAPFALGVAFRLRRAGSGIR